MLIDALFTKLAVMLVTSLHHEEAEDGNYVSKFPQLSRKERNWLKNEEIERDIRLNSWTVRPF